MRGDGLSVRWCKLAWWAVRVRSLCTVPPMDAASVQLKTSVRQDYLLGRGEGVSGGMVTRAVR